MTEEQQRSPNQPDDDTRFIHPEPPADTPETQTDTPGSSTDQPHPTHQAQDNNTPSSDHTPANNQEPGGTSTPQQPLTNHEELTESTPSKEGEDLIQKNGLLQIKPSCRNNSILQIDLTTNSGNINRPAFIKVDYDPLTVISISGKQTNDNDAFRELIQDNLVDPNGSAIDIGGQTEKTILWGLNCVDAGHYAPVMITK